MLKGILPAFVIGTLMASAMFAAEAPNDAKLSECFSRGGLPNFFSKLKEGQQVRIGYLGGSITAQNGWRPKTLAWFQKQYPNAKVSEINAAIGGTGSDLGVFRLRQDVLEYKPDLLFVEFAVNDAGAATEQIHRCMEGIVRQTWAQDRETDICFVYTIAGNMLQDLQAERLPRSMRAMETLAAHYEIPTINMGLEVARLEKGGKLIFKAPKPKTDEEKAALGKKVLFSPDAVHPYEDTGHQLYLEAVMRAMEQIQKAGHPGAHAAGEPLRPDNWEAAKLIPLEKVKKSEKWQRLDPSTNNLARQFKKYMPQMWQAGQAGDSITFKFNGTIARMYDVVGPDCGQVSVVVDERPAKVQPRFDAYCTYHRLQSFSILSEPAVKEHTIRISVISNPPDKAKILAQRNEKMDNPKRFEGINWYAGAILLVGELVE